MAKLSLNPEPTFKARAPIPVPGKPPVPVEFTFKYRDVEEFEAYLNEVKGLEGESMDNNVAIVMKCVCGWELDDPFGEESVRVLLKKYHRSAFVIADTYVRELVEGRSKN